MEITDIKGNKKEISCIACAIQSGTAEAPDGVIATSLYFQAEQDFEIPIPGFIIIASKRHIFAVDEFTDDEKLDFINFLTKVRSAMRTTLHIEHSYMILEEDTTSSHFHIWLFPRYDWMKEKFGTKIESVKPIMKWAIENLKTDNNLSDIKFATQELRDHLSI